jgi:hypothetical protein
MEGTRAGAECPQEATQRRRGEALWAHLGKPGWRLGRTQLAGPGSKQRPLFRSGLSRSDRSNCRNLNAVLTPANRTSLKAAAAPAPGTEAGLSRLRTSSRLSRLPWSRHSVQPQLIPKPDLRPEGRSVNSQPGRISTTDASLGHRQSEPRFRYPGSEISQ